MDDSWALIGWLAGGVAFGVSVALLVAAVERWWHGRCWRHPLTRYPKHGLDDHDD